MSSLDRGFPTPLLLRLKDSVTLRLIHGGFVLKWDGNEQPFSCPWPEVRQGVQSLAGSGVSRETLLKTARQVGPSSLNFVRGLLQDLHSATLLLRVLRYSDRDRAVLEPMSPSFPFDRPFPPEGSAFWLGRYSLLRRSEDRLLLESPETCARIWYPSGTAVGPRLTGHLTEPRSFENLVTRLDDVPDSLVRSHLALMEFAGMLESPETSDQRGGDWEFHDWLFHWRSRLGRHNDPYGSVPIEASQGEDASAPKPANDREFLTLPEPDPDNNEPDVAFRDILKNRRTRRSQGDEPINRSQLGEFLYYSARVTEPDEDNDRTVLHRPHPTAGGLGELEIYPLVGECEGLDSGLYHYRSTSHELELVRSPGESTKALLEGARRATNTDFHPQIVLLVSARMRRLRQKYQSLCYSLILKDVGVLFQTFYLVATYLDLAPCAIGGGNAEDFRRASGLDPGVETSVGEFMLNRPPDA